jgi:hypothetical protein
LEQQQHNREQLFDCDDESNGAANDAAAEHHGFRGDVNTAAVAARVDAVDDAAGSAKIPIVTRRQKNVPAPLAPGPSRWSSGEFAPRSARSAEDGIDPEREGRTGDRLYRLKFNS